MTDKSCKLAILISGSGSNLQAFIDATKSGQLDADIALVVSNKPGVQGLERARQAGIETALVEHKKYASREEFDQALVDTLTEYAVDLVILAGFMRILTSVFIQPFAGKLMNIHPSLLPKYPGLDTHQRAIDAGDTLAGATVHFVTEELDGGPPIIQAQIALTKNDSVQSLAARVLRAEHKIYPQAAQWFAQKKLQLKGGKVYIDNEPIADTGRVFED
jgi:phosphoribosylglycinamide formyltransferase-1